MTDDSKIDVLGFPLKWKNETTKKIIEVRTDTFDVCKAKEITVPEWCGLKNRKVLVHRTADNKWDIRKL